MDDMQYLTKELKEYYMSDFEKLLTYKYSEFWDIDEGIEEMLRLVNSNNNIQSLYSKKFALKSGSWILEQISYLEIAFTKKIESELLLLLMEIKNLLSNNDSTVNITVQDPCDNDNYGHKETSTPLGCITNPDYFRLKHVRIEIESSDMKYHDLFWNYLTSKLNQLSSN